ncbi:hypothetical protein KDK95_13390 [Actinospica sp. MGRD01-02]|uniref:Uncharacterized protein n=1 Tax=Actinospica acidithermotolerans TaxID=2828514 RepID=A0A941EBK5_9ACTN|nr:DUF6204 family protein [Actinospica acidithermotolerans]MBR7827305.1 hypothetical protein [Actinospica acidithermotolerans]
MTSRTFRITVRGTFADLGADQRAALLADAAAHDILEATYTREGHLTYDIAARPAFTFRFEDSGEDEADILLAAERAEQSAQAWLEQHGYAYKNLKSQAEDLSQAALGKRQKQQIRKTQA